MAACRAAVGTAEQIEASTERRERNSDEKTRLVSVSVREERGESCYGDVLSGRIIILTAELENTYVQIRQIDWSRLGAWIGA
jgi:hypothetical protein